MVWLVFFFFPPSLVVCWSKLFQKQNVSSIPFLPDPPRDDLLGFFLSRNWAGYLLSGPNHLNSTCIQLPCSKTSTYTPPSIAYDAYAHAITLSGNANSNQIFSSQTGVICGVHFLMLKNCGHNEGAQSLFIVLPMNYDITAKIVVVGILARISSISAKETAFVSIACLPCPPNPLDISVSEPRFRRDM